MTHGQPEAGPDGGFLVWTESPTGVVLDQTKDEGNALDGGVRSGNGEDEEATSALLSDAALSSLATIGASLCDGSELIPSGSKQNRSTTGRSMEPTKLMVANVAIMNCLSVALTRVSESGIG